MYFLEKGLVSWNIGGECGTIFLLYLIFFSYIYQHLCKCSLHKYQIFDTKHNIPCSALTNFCSLWQSSSIDIEIWKYLQTAKTIRNGTRILGFMIWKCGFAKPTTRKSVMEFLFIINLVRFVFEQVLVLLLFHKHYIILSINDKTSVDDRDATTSKIQGDVSSEWSLLQTSTGSPPLTIILCNRICFWKFVFDLFKGSLNQIARK